MRNFTIEIPKVTSSKHVLMDNTMFFLPPELEASQPPEARGLGRDDVRLMVSNYLDDKVKHTRFKHFADYLEAGDVVVINTSGTRKAARQHAQHRAMARAAAACSPSPRGARLSPCAIL